MLQARPAGAGVVHGQAHTASPHRAQRAEQLVIGGDLVVLGQLQHQVPGRRQPVEQLGEGVGHHRGRRRVDRQEHGVVQPVEHGQGAAQGQQLQVDAERDRRRFAEPLRRGAQGTIARGEAGEGLDAHHGAVPQVDDGLEDHR
ncbi:MAG: hypothetical protein R2755_22730 [Acidimicrobiales bacterium]